jgi:ubiquinone/menaquinone biosynthesis C-methylase UbiE
LNPKGRAIMGDGGVNVGMEAACALPVPDYLEDNYWWAYVRPRAVWFFDRQWMVNLILFGNAARLTDAALEPLGPSIAGRTLQIACVYGSFSARLAERIAPGGSLDIVDVLGVQLRNVRRKFPASAPVRTLQRDSTALQLESASYDQVVLFFLLHEQPDEVRQQTVREALRVVKPGGKLVIVDYHHPSWWHPLRFILPPALRLLEPFALGLWRRPIDQRLPKGLAMRCDTIDGGLYQRVVVTV